MFWRFGFHACSAIDTLLDKPDVTLEEILGEDDLLQECKAHNTKLIEYLRDPNILSKLLNYIIADEQVDDKAKFKYRIALFPVANLLKVFLRLLRGSILRDLVNM